MTVADLLVVAAVTVAVAIFIALFYKQLLFMTFDPEVAPIFGMRTGRVDTLFALALAATIVASINVVGVTLIAATLIIPATTARLLTDAFGRMLVLSAFLGAARRWPGHVPELLAGRLVGSHHRAAGGGHVRPRVRCGARWAAIGRRGREAPVAIIHGRPQVFDDL